LFTQFLRAVHGPLQVLAEQENLRELGLAPHHGLVRVGRAGKHAEQARVEALFNLVARGKVDNQDRHVRDKIASPLRQLAQGCLGHLGHLRFRQERRRQRRLGVKREHAQPRLALPCLVVPGLGAKAQAMPGVGIAGSASATRQNAGGLVHIADLKKQMSKVKRDRG
jgi:hypothetical protein